MNARKKRLEKSIANNPLANKQNPEYNAENTGNASYQNRKRKSQQAPDESYVKKGRFNKDFNKNTGRFNQDSNNTGSFNQGGNNGRFNNNANNAGRFNKGANRNNNRFNKNDQPNEIGKFVKRQNDEEREYTGLTAKEGALHKMRNNHKLRAQEQIHKETVKRDKKNSKRAWRLKKAGKERVKQPKQKINKDKAEKSRRNKKMFNKGNA